MNQFDQCVADILRSQKPDHVRLSALVVIEKLRTGSLAVGMVDAAILTAAWINAEPSASPGPRVIKIVADDSVRTGDGVG